MLLLLVFACFFHRKQGQKTVVTICPAYAFSACFYMFSHRKQIKNTVVTICPDYAFIVGFCMF